MVAYRGGWRHCAVCETSLHEMAQGTWDLPCFPVGHASNRGYVKPACLPVVCVECWRKPPTMRVFDAVVAGRMTAEQGAALLERPAPVTWWMRAVRFLADVAWRWE